jgi:hypothetical protein
VKHLSGAQFKWRLLALPENIRLSWNGLAGTNPLAYYRNLQLKEVKSFITLTPGTAGRRSAQRPRSTTEGGSTENLKDNHQIQGNSFSGGIKKGRHVEGNFF